MHVGLALHPQARLVLAPGLHGLWHPWFVGFFFLFFSPKAHKGKSIAGVLQATSTWIPQAVWVDVEPMASKPHHILSGKPVVSCGFRTFGGHI